MAAACLLGTVGTVATVGSSVAGASASTYVIGNIGTYSGPVSGDYNAARLVLTAWEKAENAAGGINGHPVKIISLDDQGNPTIALQDAQQLVQQDHVLAVVDDNSNGGTSYGDYLEKAGVPLVGATSNPPAPTDTLFFPVGPSTLGVVYGEVAAANLVHAKKIGVLYCAESAVCGQAVPLIKADAAKVGTSVTYSAAAPETSPSYAAFCLAAKQSGATALLVLLASPGVISIAQGCKQQGYNVTMLGGVAGPAFAAVPEMNGSVTASAVFPWIENSTPATEAYHTAINKYEPSIKSMSSYNAFAAYPWADLQMFALGAAKMKSATPAGLAAGLNTIKNQNLGGLIGPTTYTAGKQFNPTCYFSVQLKSGKYVALNGGKYTCPPASAS